MEISYPCDQTTIEEILPHRPPFLWLSRVLDCKPGHHTVAELDVDPSLELFKGHFPAYPVLPGVIIMEALAQAASFALLVDEGRAGSIGFLTGIDKAKFRRQVRPGDTLKLEATIVKSSRRLCVAEVKASVAGQLCASATQKYVLAHEDEGSSAPASPSPVASIGSAREPASKADEESISSFPTQADKGASR